MRFFISSLIMFLFFTPNLACNNDSDGSPCGNNTIEEGEVCDGYNLGGESCASQGYYSGTLECNDDCTLNTNACAANGWCGDSILQLQFEECDADNMGGETCESQGFTGGTLACSDDCILDLTACTN